MSDFLDSILSRPTPPPPRKPIRPVSSDTSPPPTAPRSINVPPLDGAHRSAKLNGNSLRDPSKGSATTAAHDRLPKPISRYNSLNGSHTNNFGFKPRGPSAAEEVVKAERRQKMALLRAANRSGNTNAVMAVASVVKAVQPHIEAPKPQPSVNLLSQSRGRPRDGNTVRPAATKTPRSKPQVVICGVVQPPKASALEAHPVKALDGPHRAADRRPPPPPKQGPPEAAVYGDNFDDLDGFIDDAPLDGNDWKSALRSVTGYNPSAFSGTAQDDDDDSMMESSIFEQADEEKRAERIARKEDAEQLKLILAERAEDARSTVKKRRKK